MMSAESNAPRDGAKSIFEWPICAITRVVLKFPKQVLIAAALSALVAGLLTWRGLEFRTNRLDLLNPQSRYNQRWISYLAEFGEQDDVVVVVEGADSERIEAGQRALAEALTRPDEPFEAVAWAVDASGLQSKVLHFASSEELGKLERYLAELDRFLHDSETALSEPGASPPGRADRPQERPNGGAIDGGGFVHDGTESPLSQAMSSAFAEMMLGEPYRWPLDGWDRFGELQRGLRPRPFRSADGSLGFVTLRLALPPSNESLIRSAPAIQRLQKVVSEVAAAHPDLTIGATGMPIMEHDEMESSQFDMTVATVVSFVGVAVLLLAGFGGWRSTIITLVVLFVGMAWSFGFVTIAIGHLNILSISFAAILIGLGIDFGIHYLARYEQLLQQGLAAEAALQETARSVGPGVITGALTTSAAFYMAGLTEFTGVAELGWIAGTGILLCLASALTVFPAIVWWFDCRNRSPVFRRARRNTDVRDVRGTGAATLPMQTWLQPLLRRPGFTLAGLAALALLAAPGVVRVRYDHNLLHLQPERGVSSRLQEKLIARDADHVWFAVAMAEDAAEVERLEQAFARLPTVLRTESLRSLLPANEPSKRTVIGRVQDWLTQLPPSPPNHLLSPSALLERAESTLRVAQRNGPGHDLGPETAAAGGPGKLPVVSDLSRGVQREILRRRATEFRTRFLSDLWSRLGELARISDPAPPTMEDLPPELRRRLVGQSGRMLVRVFARGDSWDFQQLEAFVRDLESVTKSVTGHPVQTYYASRHMQQSYLHAGIYAALALVIVLVLDFRSLAQSLLAMVPLALAGWLLLGVMGYSGIPFNAANMIVLPLILGIGIDSGVHVMHDFRSQTGIFRISNSVVVSIVICSTTTMTGFCSMVAADHRGLRSLGQVLTLGIFFCVGGSLLLLPSILVLLRRSGSALLTNCGFSANGFTGNLGESALPGADSEGRTAEPSSTRQSTAIRPV
ncbi:MAG: hypothetical protein FJ295_01420 [Planctomycetes bacterium]|nr:hypothetical protein [Planctomycetota bacterium]